MKKQKILSLLLALTMLFSIALPVCAESANYSDISGHWAENSIMRWSKYNIVQGIEHSFLPDAPLTRAQLATVISNLLSLKTESENNFFDVAENAWYKSAVLRCAAADILKGSENLAKPDSSITREEAMTMLCRALNIETSESADLSAFADNDEVASWAVPYVYALTSENIVGGIGEGMLAPKADMTRAALMTLLDKAILQYINESGEYLPQNGDGIILIAADNIKLTDKTNARVIISPAVNSETVVFSTEAAIAPAEDNEKEETSNIKNTGTASKKRKGGSSAKSNDLVIDEEKEITGGKYDSITITDAVGDGEVTLTDVEISGDLTVSGGGSDSVKLVNCKIGGRVIMCKEGGEMPRLSLTNTPLDKIKIDRPAIIEAEDALSEIDEIIAAADVTVKGEATDINSLIIMSEAETDEAITATVNGGTLGEINAKTPADIKGDSGSVSKVVAEASIIISTDIVPDVEIPETAENKVTIEISDNVTVEIEVIVNSNYGVIIIGANIIISTDKEEENPDLDITLNDEKVTHAHTWGEPVVTEAACEDDGKRLYTCTSCPVCTDESCEHTDCITEPATKIEIIPALGHDWSEWESDWAYHWRTCLRDEEHFEEGECDFNTFIKADENYHELCCGICGCAEPEEELMEHRWLIDEIITEPTEDTDGEVIYCCKDCKATKQVITPYEILLDIKNWIDYFEDKDDYFEVGYYENNDTYKDAMEIDIDKECVVYVNGALAGTLEEINTAYAWTDDASELLLTAHNVVFSAKYDMLTCYDTVYITKYDYDMVKSVDVENMTIHGVYGDISLNADDHISDFTYKIYYDVEEISFSDLKENDVLNMVWENANQKWDEAAYVNIYVTRNVINGIVTESAQDFNEIWYVICHPEARDYHSFDSDKLNLEIDNESELGLIGDFYLTIDNKIIAFVPGELKPLELEPVTVTNSLAVATGYMAGLNKAGDIADGLIFIQNGAKKKAMRTTDYSNSGHGYTKEIITVRANEDGELTSAEVIYRVRFGHKLEKTYDAESKTAYVVGLATDCTNEYITLDTDIYGTDEAATYYFSDVQNPTYVQIDAQRLSANAISKSELSASSNIKQYITVLSLDENEKIMDVIQIEYEEFNYENYDPEFKLTPEIPTE